MALKLRQAEFEYLVHRAATLLGGEGRGVVLDHAMKQALLKVARFESRQGLAGGLPLQQFHGDAGGHFTLIGLERYRARIDGHEFPVVSVINGFNRYESDPLEDLWVVPPEHYRRVYRYLRRQVRKEAIGRDVAPLMRDEDRRRLFDNTVGFLRRGRELLERYGVPQKRGVLLLGEPGNGKTMACRWLLAQCRKSGLVWRHVSPEQYDSARCHAATQVLFDLTEPGIVLFDDFDLGMRHRDEVGATRDHSALLSGLDGLEQRQGVVYIFTSNARLSELDPAFLRRGRIDVVIQFQRPDAELRRRLVQQFWHTDILAAIDPEQVVADTAGRSFAEIEELKRLLVLEHLDTGRWDWSSALAAFGASQELPRTTKRIGFNASLDLALDAHGSTPLRAEDGAAS
jgi:hypothetical protein